MDFVGMVMTGLFISFFDWVAYTLLSAAYAVFLAVSQINIFATEGGMEIFSTVSKQLYTVIGIAMVFVFAYQLILLIINPDGGNSKAPSKLFFDSVISVIMVLVLPTIFNYMSVFQEHVLKNGTIPAILLGTTATTDIGDDAGNKIAVMVLTAFYHPENATYTTFYDENGELRSDAQSRCTSEGSNSDVCTKYVDALSGFESDHKIASITGVASLREAVYKDDKGMSYMWLLSTAAAVLVAWFFITYSIDIGARAVKLGFLQLISPIPVILRIFPQSRKTYEVWFGELKNSYIEIFVRLAVIFFVVRLIQVLPSIVGSIFDSTSGVVDNIILKCIALVLLILGMLKFAQEAPELIKTMFNTGGNLLKGVNLKPGVRKHIEDNKYGMAAMTGVAGMAAGFAGGMRNAYRMNNERKGVDGDVPLSSYTQAIYGGLRGAVTGAVHGTKNASEHLTYDDFKKAQVKASQHAQQSHRDGNFIENTGRRVADARRDNEGGTFWGRRVAEFKAFNKPLADLGKDMAEHHREVVGIKPSTSATHESIAAMQKIIEPVMSTAKGGEAALIKQGQTAYQTQMQTSGSAMQNVTLDRSMFKGANGQYDETVLEKFMAGRKIEGADLEAIKQALDTSNGGAGTFTGNIEIRRDDKNAQAGTAGKMLSDSIEKAYKKATYDAMAGQLKDNPKAVESAIATLAKTQSERTAQIGSEAIAAMNKEIVAAVSKASQLGFDMSAYSNVQTLEQLSSAMKDRPITGGEAVLIESISKGLSSADKASQFKPKE